MSKRFLHILDREQVQKIAIAAKWILAIIITIAVVSTAKFAWDIRQQLLDTIIPANAWASSATATGLASWSLTVTNVTRGLWVFCAIVTIGYSLGLIWLYLRLQRSHVVGDWRPRVGLRISHILLLLYIMFTTLERVSVPTSWWRVLLAWGSVIMSIPALHWVNRLDRNSFVRVTTPPSETPD